MFTPSSRYSGLETATYTALGGAVVAYKRRRFLPQGQQMPLLVELSVVQGDRLDLIAARTLGDAEQFWLICDANNAMNPDDLTAQPGTVLRIALPQTPGVAR